MIALSFIGVSNYQETTYSYKNKIIKTKLFPYAFYKFTEPSKLYVIMTKKAKDAHAKELSKVCTFQELLIPDGKTENEIWQMFDLITDVIPANEKVIFDITHGFRSQPFIVIVLLLYLKALKNIKINNIIYGAFEAKDENNITPVFELKSFIDLIDWSNAVREFTENGNMKYFNNLLSEIHKNSYLKKLPNPSKELKGAGVDLSKLTDAFATIRLKEIFQNSYHFNQRLEILKTDLENNPQAKPFGTLISKISKQFEAISKAEKNIFSDKGFIAQKSILQWYVETSKYQKAITLAREYIISKYLLEISKEDTKYLLNKNKRLKTTNELGQLLKLRQSGSKAKNRKSEYVNLWSKITDMRNDINHAGMKKNPTPSRALIDNITEIIKTIVEKF